MSKENSYIHNMLSTYFTARHFQRIPTDIEEVAMYATFQKSSLYLVNLINLNADYKYDETMYGHYVEMTKQQFKEVNADNIILLNIMITNNPMSIYENVNKTPNLESTFIDVHWIIDSEKSALIIPKNQLSSVLGLERPIIELLNTGTNEVYNLNRVTSHEYITYILAGINIIMWFLLEWYGGSTDVNVLLRFGAMNTQYIQETGQYWRLLTAMFLHIGILHLLFNMLGLYIFGSRLEKYLTGVQFVSIYLLSGLIGGLAAYFGNILMNQNVVSAGASGAIYGLIGSLLVLSKAAHRPIGGLNSYIIWLFFIYGVIYSFINPSVDAFAHIGGFVGGLLLSIPIVKSKKEQVGG